MVCVAFVRGAIAASLTTVYLEATLYTNRAVH